MKYSRNKLNIIGKTLASESSDLLDYAEAVTLVEDWRKTHLEPLRKLSSEIESFFVSSGVPAAFSSQRLKRMTSIIGKLKRNPQMGLGGLQDIGGLRFVFDDIPTLKRAMEVVQSFKSEEFEIIRAPYDYVSHPKDSGYRSIHFVFKHHSADPEVDGLSLELQIRTRLQHDWATAVETAELISKSSLKASLGDENWLNFFKVVSAIFAHREEMPAPNGYSNYSQKDLCIAYNEINTQNKFLDQLQALVGAVEVASTHSFERGYAVLLIQFEEKKASLRHFSDSELELANDLYSQLESSVDREKGAVVLVSVADIKNLQEAYPSYFLNAKEFIDALTAFSDNCRVMGYIV